MTTLYASNLQKRTTFATQNNWILPIKEDEMMRRLDQEVYRSLDLPIPVDPQEHIQWVREMALEKTFNMERTPIWESMATFFPERFSAMTYTELRILADQLGIKRVGRSHGEAVRTLVLYFQAKVGISCRS